MKDRYHVIYHNSYEGPFIISFEHDFQAMKFIDENVERQGNSFELLWVFDGSLCELETKEVKTHHVIKRGRY